MKELKRVCIPPRRKKKKKNSIFGIDNNLVKSNDNDNKVFNDATIELIVTIENSILKFIKNMSNKQEN